MIISRFFISQFSWNFACKAQLIIHIYQDNLTYQLFGYERAYLPVSSVANTYFHIQEDDIRNTELSNGDVI